jgi:putative PIN family toxin of toxin-antitoxin system
MRVCIDTNVLLQLFSNNPRWPELLEALTHGRVKWAVSTSILLEDEEVTVRQSGPRRWQQVAGVIDALDYVLGSIRFVDPRFQFHAILADPDDNKFSDCAIAAQADFILTEDAHFDALRGSGHKPQPISPDDFIRQHLTQGN